MHVLTIVQLSLIGVGLVFQIIAMSALYRNSSDERSDGEHEEWRERKVDLGRRSRPKGGAMPRHSVHDYYEIEKTPPGVRPGDLRKTARVKYMDNVNAPPPE